MKTFARLAFVAAAALGATLFFSGCTTARVANRGRPAHYFDMTVLQSSGPVDLSLQEMTQLREAVIGYIQREGVLHNGAYYVKVTFKPGDHGPEANWVVVKMVERTLSDFEMAGSYVSRGPYYYDPFYNNYGYASFGNYPFDSFDYTYGDSIGYYPPQFHPRDHGPYDHDHNNDNNRHDGRHDVAHNGGRGDPHSPRDGGGDHHSPEPRHWGRGDSGSSTASYSPPSSSGNNGGGSSYSPPSPPPPSNPEPDPGSGGDRYPRDTSPVAAK